jgi:integral membrane protein
MSPMNHQKLLSRFRFIAIAEGISFLLLLGIAMPLKYLADLPEGVTIVGWIHGILFVAFLVVAFEVKAALNKNLLWFGKAFIASVLPFGTFILEKQMRKEQSA